MLSMTKIINIRLLLCFIVIHRVFPLSYLLFLHVSENMPSSLLNFVKSSLSLNDSANLSSFLSYEYLIFLGQIFLGMFMHIYSQ